MEATLLALDWLLGEDEVARWVGDIIAAAFEPIDAVRRGPPARRGRRRRRRDSTEEQWVALEGRTATGRRLTAAARFPLRPVDFPLYDQHIAITLPYRDTDDEGQPAGGSAEALREFEERLVKRLTELGDAVLVAHVSAEGCRVMHVYADPEGGAAEPALDARWPEGAGTDAGAAPPPVLTVRSCPDRPRGPVGPPAWRSAEPGAARALDHLADHLGEAVDVRLGGGVAEREAQRAPGRAASAPIASSTWLGWATPAEQAEPVEHSTPLASSSISRASPSQPGKEKCALPGSRSTGSPLSTASGTACAYPLDQVVPQRGEPRGERLRCSDRELGPPRRSPAMAGASSVPDRTSRSWPPPCSTGTGVDAAAQQQRADADGPPILCPVTVIASTPEAAKSTGSWPTACTASVWNGTPYSCGDRGEFGDRLDGADLVVRPHHADQRDVAGVALDGLAQRLRVHPAVLVDREPLHRRRPRVGEPAGRSRARRGARPR